MRKALILCIIALFAACTAVAATSIAPMQKIYVASMGQSDEAERFRMLLGNELSKRGFTVVDSVERADAILSGVLTVRVHADDSVARATIVLKSKEGDLIWGRDMGPHFGWGSSEPVKRRAEDIAKELRKLLVKSRKNS